MVTRLQGLRYRLLTIDLLRLAKRHYTYRELSKELNLSITVLSRYTRGHVLPTLKRARQIWKKLSKLVSLESEILSRIKFDEYGYFDNTSIIFDTALLEQATQYALEKFAGMRITKVLTAAVDGIPLATMIANAINVNLVVAKKEKEVGVRDFIEEIYIPSSAGVMISLYLPKGAIKKRDSVLIVDDVMRSGETQRALINLVEKAKAEVSGVFVLVAVGDEWKEKIGPRNFPLEAVVHIRSRLEGFR